ncbi:MAG: 4-alpha-glucanotransferase [Propionibacteriaceae bacterium]|jgi:4-alpha-glucanotransferase|nr:4-alpha-glucanotransferase [Propionibacteriaceae bacterium]
MTAPDSTLSELASRYGISTEFWDWKGNYVPISAETIIACLAALDVDASSPEKAWEALDAHERWQWKRHLPDCVVVEQNQDRVIDVQVMAGASAHVWVRCEDGRGIGAEQVANDWPDREVDGQWRGRASFRLPTWIELGYHTVILESGEERYESPFIVTPSWVGVPQKGFEKVWGFMTQLYSISGQNSWCFGDMSDLTDLAVWSTTQHGAGFVLTNPVHAAEPISRIEPSPYLPCSRRYVNPLYIRPEAIEEYLNAPDSEKRAIRSIRTNLDKRMVGKKEIDRDSIWAEKKKALRRIFALERRPVRQMEMEAFFAAEAEPLRDFATWCALCEKFGTARWKKWDEGFQRPNSAEVQAFAEENAETVTFYMWMQWIAESQAIAAHRTALAAGMPVGVMSDLAVGVHTQGAESWSMGGAFAQGVTVGAPPDGYNQAGQDWTQPPWRPDRLEQSGYRPFRAMVKAALRHSGGLRVDHIIGLFRLWWIPEGFSPKEGTYVRYNHEALIGILALEALRSGAVVIGEDLGTVEPWVRDYLRRRGLLGTSVLWFEYNDDGSIKAPEQWREYCMASVTTHDLPPTLGYLSHSHVYLRNELGLLTESLDEEINKDVQEQAGIMSVLADRGLMEQGERDPQQRLLALHRYLLKAPSKLLCVALTDAVGEKETENQPGTLDEYPNWRVPLHDDKSQRLTLEEIYTMERVKDLTDIMNGKA